jgi:hypothetical protein
MALLGAATNKFEFRVVDAYCDYIVSYKEYFEKGLSCTLATLSPPAAPWCAVVVDCAVGGCVVQM